MLCAVAVALTWAPKQLVPSEGLDPSWMFALSDLQHHGRLWGSDVAFTYGPLGFLTTPNIARPGYFAAALLFRLALVLCLAATVRRFIGLSWRRPSNPPLMVWPASVLAAGLVFGLFPNISELALSTYALVLYLFREAIRSGRPPHRWAKLAIGAPAALLLLVKFNVGITAFALLIACIVLPYGSMRRFRQGAQSLATVLAGSAGLVLLLWLVAGQRMSLLPGYLRQSWSGAVGYSQAMWVDMPSSRWTWWFVVALAAGAVAALRRARVRGREWLITEAVVLSIAFYFALKGGYVRQDGSHIAIFLVQGALALVPLILGSDPQVRRTDGPTADALDDSVQRSHLAPVLACGVVALSLVVSSMVAEHPLSEALAPRANAVEFGRTIQLLTSPAQRKRTMSSLMVDLTPRFSSAQTLVRRHALTGPVDIEPWDYDYAWRLGLVAAQPPAFQRYFAYTPDLDAANANFYSSGTAPEYVLYHSDSAIDNRMPAYEAPRSFMAMFCNYEELDHEGEWSLLRRSKTQCTSNNVPLPPSATCLSVVTAAQPVGSLLVRLRGALIKPSTEDSVSDEAITKRLTGSSWGTPLPYIEPGGTVDFPDVPTLTPAMVFSGPDGVATRSFGKVCKVDR